MSKNHAANRKQFAKQMKPGSMLILFAGSAPVKRGDELYPFAPQRNFLYLTGIDAPRVIFLMIKDHNEAVTECLFLERPNELTAKWSGAVLSAEDAMTVSGITSTSFLDLFEDTIATYIMRHNIEIAYIDMENRSFDAPVTADLQFAQSLGAQFPAMLRANAYPMFARLRAVKSKEEIRHIRRAIHITRDGLYAMMQKARPGMMEYEIEAHFDYTLKKNGVRQPAFATIAASGANAAVLHYGRNNSQTHDGNLLLCDAGAQVNWYSADVTRTFPVSGIFSERQKQLYNIVLEGQKKVIAAIRPGVSFSALNETLLAHYGKELKKIGLIEKREDVGRYYYHSVSHMLGLETHDIGRGVEGALKKGMVLTVEPGLYIAEESIGIRIEDDVLVTDDGCEVLSASIMKTVDEIETFMNRKKPAAH